MRPSYPDWDAVDHELVDTWIDEQLRIAERPGAAQIALRANMDTWRELRWRERFDPDERTRYSVVNCPTWIAWGELDNVLDPSVLLVLQSELPNCRTRVFWGAGHELLGLKDKAVLDWLDCFLASVSEDPQPR